MKILTHTHDIHLYGIAVLLTASLGCSNIASHLYSRWFAQRNINVMLVHWLVKSVIILWGIFIIPISVLFNASLLMEFVSILPAIYLGMICVKIEMIIRRKLIRRKSNRKLNPSGQYIILRDVPNKTQGLSSVNSVSKVNLKNVHEHHARLDTELISFQLRDVVLVAVCEEIIYRGFLWKLALLLPNMMETFFAWIFSVILFGASHLNLGRGQCLSKTILGGFCMISVVVTQTILSAIIIHVVFNILAYQAMRESTKPRMRYSYGV